MTKTQIEFIRFLKENKIYYNWIVGCLMYHCDSHYSILELLNDTVPSDYIMGAFGWTTYNTRRDCLKKIDWEFYHQKWTNVCFSHKD